MIDINAEAEKALSGISCTLTYYHPENFNSLPVVSFYTLTENDTFSVDNCPEFQRGYIAVDVWAAEAVRCGAIAIEAHSLLAGHGWVREFSRDLPPESGVYHKTMRFVKDFYL